MPEPLQIFERVVRNAFSFSEQRPLAEAQHPFEARDIHPALPKDVRKLFDNGHYSQATFEGVKFLDKEVKRHSRSGKAGKALMMEALSEAAPLVKLTPLSNQSERDEQEGYKFLFAGTIVAIRNPRGHEYSVTDDIGLCLDHLGIVSHLLRRMEMAGYAPSEPKRR